MNNNFLPKDIKDIIFSYEQQLKYKHVMDELKKTWKVEIKMSYDFLRTIRKNKINDTETIYTFLRESNSCLIENHIEIHINTHPLTYVENNCHKIYDDDEDYYNHEDYNNGQVEITEC